MKTLDIAGACMWIAVGWIVFSITSCQKERDDKNYNLELKKMESSKSYGK